MSVAKNLYNTIYKLDKNDYTKSYAIFLGKNDGVKVERLIAEEHPPFYYRNEAVETQPAAPPSREEKIMQIMEHHPDVIKHVKRKKMSKYDAYVYSANMFDKNPDEMYKKILNLNIDCLKPAYEKVEYEKTDIFVEYEPMHSYSKVFRLKFTSRVLYKYPSLFNKRNKASILSGFADYRHYIYVDTSLLTLENLNINNLLEKNAEGIIDGLIALKVINNPTQINCWQQYKQKCRGNNNYISLNSSSPFMQPFDYEQILRT